MHSAIGSNSETRKMAKKKNREGEPITLKTAWAGEAKWGCSGTDSHEKAGVNGRGEKTKGHQTEDPQERRL